VMLIFEKIHLMGNSFNVLLFFFTVCFEHEDSVKLIGQLIELADTDLLMSDGSLVLGNMALKSIGDLSGPIGDFCDNTNDDVIGFWLNARSVIDREILFSMKNAIEKEMHAFVEMDVEENGCWIDFRVPSKRLAVLVSSPLQIIGETSPTGTGILRYRATVASLPHGWTVANMSATEWTNATEEGRQAIIRDLLRDDGDMSQEATREESSSCEEETLVTNESDFVIPDEDDLSPFIQKDRSAAHRRRAPPNTSLPWVPSVFSLKRKPRGVSGNRRR